MRHVPCVHSPSESTFCLSGRNDHTRPSSSLFQRETWGGFLDSSSLFFGTKRKTHTHTLHAVPNKLENVTDRLPLPRGHWDVLDHVWSLDQTTRVRDANGREECHSDTDCGSRRRLWKHYFH